MVLNISYNYNMAKGKRTGGRKAPKRKYAGRKRFFNKKTFKRGVPEWASLTETRETINLMDTNQMYRLYKLQLDTHPRAVDVAKAYQLYRIAKVTVRLSPLYDTFQNASSGGNTSVPYAYFMIDRTRALEDVNNVATLKRLGATARRLDDKVIEYSYKPNVLMPTLDQLVTPPVDDTFFFTQYKVAPWLSTRKGGASDIIDSTDHLGLVWGVQNSGGLTIPYKCEIITQFQFKKPCIDIQETPGLPPPVEVEDLINPPPSA